MASTYQGHAFTDEITAHGGFTFDPRVGEFIHAGEIGRHGYAIGMPDTERVIIATGTDITPHDWTSALLDIYQAHGEALASPHVFIGAWRAPDGSIIAELSTIVDVPLADALRMARHWGQHSIWNVATGEDYATGVAKYQDDAANLPHVHVDATPAAAGPAWEWNDAAPLTESIGEQVRATL